VAQILKAQGLLPSGWEEIAVRKTQRGGQQANIPIRISRRAAGALRLEQRAGRGAETSPTASRMAGTTWC